MADEEINYTKEVLASTPNMTFIGVMAFLMLAINFWGFLPLLLAGQIGALFVAQHPRVQRIIRARKNKDRRIEVQEAETVIINSLPGNYQSDYHSLRRLCDEIERRSNDLGDASATGLLSGVIEKLSVFRYDYARMLRAHFLLSTRNYQNIEMGLTGEISRVEKAAAKEPSPQVRHALEQNLNVLKQRLMRIRKLDELVRLLEARLQVIRNSLGLVQDEVYTFTDVAGISGLVDNLLTNLRVSEEFRTAYEDVLSAEAGIGGVDNLLEGRAGMAEVEMPGSETQPQRQRGRMQRTK
ncbi:MAG TPA: hypothetical protein VJ810_17830 [Blastocatellia bacterium]|nr:hypothetical protein [Blastocatellia bacterium]